MKTRTRVDGMFAFWKYDGFPGALGGTITEMNEDGRVQTKEYGPGHWFTPIKIVPTTVGKVLLAKLEALRREHDAARAVFSKTWREMVEKLMPEAVRP